MLSRLRISLAHLDHYQLITIYLSKPIELGNLDLKQQINFVRRLEENNATMLSIENY